MLEEFKQRIGQAGIGPKGDSAYRSWYHGAVIAPRARDSLYYTTEAHDLDEVQGELKIC